MTCKYPICPDEVYAKGLCMRHHRAYSRVETTFIKARQEGAGDILAWEAIYVIGSKEMPHIKVGRAKNIRNRYDQMQTGMPYTLRLFAALYLPKFATMATEWESHQALADMGFHFRGEWFDIAPADAKAVVRKCAERNQFPFMDGSEYAAAVEYRKAVMDYQQIRSVDWVKEALKSASIEFAT